MLISFEINMNNYVTDLSDLWVEYQYLLVFKFEIPLAQSVLSSLIECLQRRKKNDQLKRTQLKCEEKGRDN